MPCVGGTSVREDIDRIRRGVHVVVGTPGRVNHMAEKGYLSLRSLKSFILDEAYVIMFFVCFEQLCVREHKCEDRFAKEDELC